MNYWKTNIVLILAAAIMLVACNGTADRSRQQDNGPNPFKDKKRLVSINQYLTEKDKDIIENHISRQGWKMIMSPDGYYYEVYKEGESPKIEEGNTVDCEYTISLLNGTVCYKSIFKTILVGHGEEASGLHTAIKKLGKGGKAKFIFPPQLAYGLQGDLDKIPPRSVVVFDVEVINVK